MERKRKPFDRITGWLPTSCSRFDRVPPACRNNALPYPRFSSYPKPIKPTPSMPPAESSFPAVLRKSSCSRPTLLLFSFFYFYQHHPPPCLPFTISPRESGPACASFDATALAFTTNLSLSSAIPVSRNFDAVSSEKEQERRERKSRGPLVGSVAEEGRKGRRDGRKISILRPGSACLEIQGLSTIFRVLTPCNSEFEACPDHGHETEET